MEIVRKFKSYYKVAYLTNHFPSLFSLFGEKKILAYYGFLGDMNFGDELVFEAARALFASYILIPYRKRMPIILKLYINTNKSAIKGIVIGGGTLIGPRFYEHSFFGTLLSLDKPVYFHGTGVLDKYTINNYWLQILNKKFYGGIRGPLSKKNLAEKNIDSQVAGDAAFSLKRSLLQKKKGSKVLINLGSHLDFEGIDVSRREVQLFIEHLLSFNLEIAFVPCHKIDVELYNSLKARFPQIELLGIPKDFNEALQVFDQAFFAIGERLHFIVMAIVSNCPFVSINYRNKHVDLLESLSLSNFGFSPEALSVAAIKSVFNKRHEFKWDDTNATLAVLEEKQYKQAELFSAEMRELH